MRLSRLAAHCLIGVGCNRGHVVDAVLLQQFTHAGEFLRRGDFLHVEADRLDILVSGERLHAVGDCFRGNVRTVCRPVEVGLEEGVFAEAVAIVLAHRRRDIDGGHALLVEAADHIVVNLGRDAGFEAVKRGAGRHEFRQNLRLGGKRHVNQRRAVLLKRLGHGRQMLDGLVREGMLQTQVGEDAEEHAVLAFDHLQFGDFLQAAAAIGGWRLAACGFGPGLVAGRHQNGGKGRAGENACLANSGHC